MARVQAEKRPNWGILDVRYSFSRTTPLFWILVIAVIAIFAGIIFKFLKIFTAVGLTTFLVFAFFGAIALWFAIKYLFEK